MKNILRGVPAHISHQKAKHPKQHKHQPVCLLVCNLDLENTFHLLVQLTSKTRIQ